ncbi:MAG: putative quinol monooxygenase [Alistipes sp.]|nr:putative quinol monooxygenase [Alistipes sp.]
MIQILVKITVTQAHRDAVLALLEPLTVASQQETGNISYQYYLHPTDATQLLIAEQWENPEVLAVHEKTEHFTTLLPQIVKLSVGLDLQKFEARAI